MTQAELRSLLDKACNELRLVDAELLRRRLHERTITARLAHHIQKLLPADYYADCEYNKMQEGDDDDAKKCLISWANDRNAAFPHKKPITGEVLPDIIIHTRELGAVGNLAVIEAKWHADEEEWEVKKIRHYLSDLNLDYTYGYFLVLAPFQLKDVP